MEFTPLYQINHPKCLLLTKAKQIPSRALREPLVFSPKGESVFLVGIQKSGEKKFSCSQRENGSLSEWAGPGSVHRKGKYVHSGKILWTFFFFEDIHSPEQLVRLVTWKWRTEVTWKWRTRVHLCSQLRGLRNLAAVGWRQRIEELSRMEFKVKSTHSQELCSKL